MIIEKIKLKLLMAKWQLKIDHPAVKELFCRFFVLTIRTNVAGRS